MTSTSEEVARRTRLVRGMAMASTMLASPAIARDNQIYAGSDHLMKGNGNG